MKILATKILLATAFVDVLAGVMTSLKPTSFGNP